MAKTETRVFTAHVPVPLAEKVDQLAERLERSRGWIMKQALWAWIAQEEERDRLIREALADTGSTYKAAAKLGISQSTVVRKAKQLHIPVTEKKKHH